MLLFFVQHDSNNFNVKAIVNLKGSGCNIWEIVSDVIFFRQTIFGYLLDVPQGDRLLFQKMFLHQMRSDAILSPDGIKRLYFRVGDTKMVYVPEEFCLITRLNFGEYPKMIAKKVSEKIVSSKKNVYCVNNLDVWNNFSWGSYLWNFTYEDLEDTQSQDLRLHLGDMPWMKRWSGTKKLKWVDVNKIFSKTQEGQGPRNKMSPSDDEMTSCYYMSFQEYVYGEQKSVPSPETRRSSSSMSSCGRSNGRGGHNGEPSLEEVLKRLHALEQHVFMNREPTEVFVEEVNNEDLWNNISFEEPAIFQTNFDQPVVEDEGVNKNNTNENVFGDIEDDKELEKRNENAGSSRNKFDDDVFDIETVSEKDDLIITGNVIYYDAYGFDGKEVTPDRPRARNSSKSLCPPYTELHTTPKQKIRPKKKVDIKSTSLVPPPAFAVVHDFFVLRMQPYVAGSEVVIQNYLFHSYGVHHRLFNLVLDRDFWSVLFGHTHDGWLEATYHNFVQHITIWYRLMMERLFDSDRHTIMPPNFFVCHVLEEGYDWRAFMAGIATYPQLHGCLVLMPIHSSPNHWLFGELRLASMEVHIYDSFGRGAYEKFNSDGTFTKFEARVADYLDKIDYWARRNIPRIPLNMQFIFETNVPQQSSHLGDCGSVIFDYEMNWFDYEFKKLNYELQTRNNIH
uniref:Ubiquitin-like protease family profile domain-containing protein n=1 Tax=Lactuca sativa TaxID=4236 RepID=A0A9R1W226_LACSA|nr:hypothetical protein LSAT_V11C300123180 [Lactuca sativa]